MKKKICMLGSFGVGKTSLVARYVRSDFSDKYHTTVGVKIDRKDVTVDGTPLTLMIWDMAGEEEGAPIKLNQVDEAQGYLLIVDGTRRRTLEVARSIQERVENKIGKVPFRMLVNKADVKDTWEIADSEWSDLRDAGWLISETSARTGENVNEAFMGLASSMLKAQHVSEDDDE